MPTNVAIRLNVEGGGVIRRELEEAGRAGQSAFQGISTAADTASAATDKLAQKARDAAEAGRRVGGATPAGPVAVPPGQPTSPTPSPTTMREVERLRTQLDEEYRKAKGLDRAEGIITRGYSTGSFDAAERDRLRELALQRYGAGKPGSNDNDPAKAGLSTYDKQFIRYQGFDVASSLGSGASPVTVAFQQGPQVLQQLADREGGLRAGLKDLAVSAAGLVTPFTVGATAVTALGAAFVYAATQAGRDQEILEKATQGLGRTTGATASQLDTLARTNAEAGKVSASTAREIVAGYSSTGQIALPVIADLTRATSEYARITGQDVPSATAELARTFSDIANGADTLQAKIGGLDDRTRQLIQTQIEQGDKSAAQQTLADSLKASIDANAVATGGWAAQWNKAAAAASSYWEVAKQIAGIKLGIINESAQDALARTQQSLDNTNGVRALLGMKPLGLGDKQVRERDIANVIADQERRIAEGKAAEARADQASIAAGNVARAVDPNYGRLSQLRKQQSDLRDALSDPLARSKLSDIPQVEDAYTATTRAITSMTDATGKMISAEEMARRADQLRIDSLNAKTDAEKKSVAERQKAFDLIGKTVTPGDARGQIERAGTIAGIEAASGGGKKGGESEKKDDYDRAVRSIEDRIRRMGEEVETYGMAADAVARHRTETELLTAAKRAEREITPDLTAQIRSYADQAAEAAKRQDDLRSSMRDTDSYRAAGSDAIRGLAQDFGRGTAAGLTFTNMLDRLKSKLLDIGANSISESLFGKAGSSSTGLLGSLFGAAKGSGGVDVGATSWMPKFADGGWTGSGARLEAAGIVHKGEYVFDQDAVRRIGLDNLRAMHRGGLGYADGGYVGRSGGFTMPSAAPAVGAGSGPPMINFITPPGMQLEQDGPPQRRADGSYDQVLRTVESGLAGRARNGRGPLQQAAGGAWARIG